MAKKNNIEPIIFWLAVIGAINWGLSELGFNLVEMVFGSFPAVIMWVYYAVGIAGGWLALKRLKVLK